MVAGNETTRHTISHSMLALIENPEQLAVLQERPELIPGAVEEFLRWASPVYHFRRTATRDVELGGQQIKEGDKVVMWFASGQPRRGGLRATRTASTSPGTDIDHVTFGKGSPHFCLGNMLARMEIRMMFDELLPRLDEHRARRRRHPGAEQLRQRHQEVPGPRHRRLTRWAWPPRPYGRRRSPSSR